MTKNQMQINFSQDHELNAILKKLNYKESKYNRRIY